MYYSCSSEMISEGNKSKIKYLYKTVINPILFIQLNSFINMDSASVILYFFVINK